MEGFPRRGWQASSKLGLQPVCLISRDRPFLVEALREPLGVVERVAVELQRPQDREPNVRYEALGSNEAEAAVDRNVLACFRQGSLDAGYLLVEAVDELRPVATVDLELGLPEEGSGDLDLALVALAVDHVDAGGRNGDVVDVCSAAGHRAVVKHGDLGTALRQQCREALLTLSARPPVPLVGKPLSVVGRREETSPGATKRTSFPVAPFALLAQKVGLAARAAPGSAEVKILVWHLAGRIGTEKTPHERMVGATCSG